MSTRSKRANTEPVTITVGARRSWHFYPTAPIRDSDRQPRETFTSLRERQAAQRSAQIEIDAIVYHRPIVNSPKPRKRREKVDPLARAEKVGATALATDDTDDPKRSVTVGIPYTTEGGDRVVAIFGGLTSAQADAAIHRNGGSVLRRGDLWIEDGSAAGRDHFPPSLVGLRVVVWPSEATRRATIMGSPVSPCTVDEDATAEDLRIAYPDGSTRPGAVADRIAALYEIDRLDLARAA